MTPPATPAVPRFLFVPVSGPSGMGEYVRCLTLAGAVRRRWPEAAIHFLLSARAPYARATPYEHTLFPDSPTLHDRAGRAAIARFRPDVAVFDNAGRTGQLAAARAAGARVIYVSSRWRPRLKAFRFRWLWRLDEHWIPYPTFAAGALTIVERLKLGLVGGRPRVRFLDVLLPPLDETEASATLARHGLAREAYVLVVPGGGTAHRGAEGALPAFEAAAERLAAHGHAVAVVGRDAPAERMPAAAPTAPRWLGRRPPAEVAALLAGARLVVTNGGDTLLQSLACGRATVAAPIAKDQPPRLARCVAAGGVRAADATVESLTTAALALLDDPLALEETAARARALRLANGVEAAVAAFEELVARDGTPRAVRGGCG